MNWAQEAAAAKAPVFPIRIWHDGSKWQKKPLTQHGHLDASHDVSRFNWADANGFGIAMGAGWYTLDWDTHKPNCMARQWCEQWQVPLQTRTHLTVSGGYHLIYRTVGEWRELRTRQHVVSGLDTRGNGGWTAFGEGYSVFNDALPAILPDAVCVELSRAPVGRDVDLQPVQAVDAADVYRRLSVALTTSRPSLRHRWAGGTDGLHDASRSGMDMSIAKLLGLAGFGYSEIYHLLTVWPHGVVARDGLTRVTHRQICREAARATQGHGLMSRKLLEAMGHGR